MKKYGIFLTVFVLTLTLFTGCGCTAQKMPAQTAPTRATTPTNPATVAPTVPATETMPQNSAPMDDAGNSGNNGSTGTNGNNGNSGSDAATNSIMDTTTPGSGTKSRSRMR